MRRIDLYREKARRCAEDAAKAASSEAREALLEIALAWNRISRVLQEKQKARRDLVPPRSHRAR